MDFTSDNGLVANEGEVFLTTTALMDVKLVFKIVIGHMADFFFNKFCS
jgi:hypothetical protein